MTPAVEHAILAHPEAILAGLLATGAALILLGRRLAR